MGQMRCCRAGMLPAAALLLLVALPARGATPCAEGTTEAVEACLAEQLRQAEDEMERYTNAAIGQIARGDNPKRVLALFRTGDTAWSEYAEKECGAVHESWASGTIRGAQQLTCSIRLTQNRTHEIWANWLTRINGSPVLPEPAR